MDRRLSIESKPDPGAPAGLVVFGSDRGLCGRFNEIVVNHACGWLEAHRGEAAIMAIGERSATRLEARGYRAEASFLQPGSVSGLSQNAEAILLEVDTWRASKNIERVMAVFNVEAGRGRVEPRVEMILPIDSEALHRIVGRAWPSNQIPVVDGPTEQVFSAFIRERHGAQRLLSPLVGVARCRARDPPFGNAGSGAKHLGECRRTSGPFSPRATGGHHERTNGHHRSVPECPGDMIVKGQTANGNGAKGP